MVEFTMENIQVFGEQYSLECVLLIGTRSAQSIMASGFTAAQTGRTHDRTRPMLQQLRKFLPRRRRHSCCPRELSALTDYGLQTAGRNSRPPFHYPTARRCS